jgi:sulfonate transport system permease protein
MSQGESAAGKSSRGSAVLDANVLVIGGGPVRIWAACVAAATWSWPRPKRLKPANLLLPLLFPSAVLVLWQITAANAWLPPQILPLPGQVLQTLIDLVREGDIAANLKISLWRISIGFAAGVSAGLLFGTMMGVWRVFDDYVGPLFKALAQVPSLGWVPVLILIFGLDEMLKFIIIAKACFVPTVLATSQGIRNINRSYLEVSHVLMLPPRAKLRKLLIPATLPTLFGGIRLALSHAWISLIVVEMLAATEGVGYMMVWGRTLFQLDIVIAGMIIIGIIGLVMDFGLAAAERRLNRWAPRHG